MEGVRELRRCVEELGFKGLRVIPWLWEAPPTDRRFYPLLAACVDLGVPFCTQVGHTGPLRPSETGRPIPYIDQVALDFPELTIVCGHVGYPWTEEMVAVARKHENVYIDTSAYTTKRLPPELIAYLKSRGGRRKVMFGTNYPMIAPAKALEGLDELGLDEETRSSTWTATRVACSGSADDFAQLAGIDVVDEAAGVLTGRKLGHRAQPLQAATDTPLEVLETSEVRWLGADGVGNALPQLVLIGIDPALGVLDDEDLAGLQQRLGERQRAHDVFGDDAARIADHVRVPRPQPEDRGRVDSGVHAGDDRDPRARSRRRIAV